MRRKSWRRWRVATNIDTTSWGLQLGVGNRASERHRIIVRKYVSAHRAAAKWLGGRVLGDLGGTRGRIKPIKWSDWVGGEGLHTSA